MLSEQEKLQICRSYTLVCPICETQNPFFRLKRDIVRAAKAEGDGHALEYKWGKPGFDSVDPLQFYWGVCAKCRFTGELDDPEFRQAERMIKEFRANLHGEGLRNLLTSVPTGKGIAQALGKRLDDADPLVVVIAQFHLGIYSQCLRLKLVPGNLARYYLRLAWLYRDVPKFYPSSTIEKAATKFEKLKTRFEVELPEHKDYPIKPGLALVEVEALRYSRVYFERNYETLREAKPEDELRLRLLLAEIGYRVYELTNTEEDYLKASTFFSGIIQQCLSIISDKSIVGGAVNRAKGMLESAGERGRELRALNKSRGGAGAAVEADAGPGAGNGKKKTKKVKPVATKANTAPQEVKSSGAVNATAAKSAKGEPAKSIAEKEPVAKSAVVIEDGAVGDLDQATRQVAILQGEVTQLQGRVEELEEDNKRWRQLAGRDAVTGLPNKTMLFRLVFPKILKGLKNTGPYSCIAISLDQVGKVNEGHGWMMGDKMLKESSRSLRRFAAEGEELYRLDGAHFALVGPMDNNTARQRAADMRRRLARASLQVDDSQLPLVSSIGVVTVERILSGALAEVSNKVYEALLHVLYRAKEKGGNTVEIHNSTKF
jgi:diguanylate cyclase (GGDEF)-like protein